MAMASKTFYFIQTFSVKILSIGQFRALNSLNSIASFVEMMARVSTSDNLYLIQTVSSPKQYCQIMGGTGVYIGQKRIRWNKWAESKIWRAK
jgi:hypothetical protein